MRPICCHQLPLNKKLKKVAEFLAVVSEKNRLKILCLLREGDRCVCDIWQCLKLPQNLTSHHLKILKDCNLVSSRWAGLKIFYSLNKKVVKDYLNYLNKILK
jgi:ArsR family transcriptional regulator